MYQRSMRCPASRLPLLVDTQTSACRQPMLAGALLRRTVACGAHRRALLRRSPGCADGASGKGGAACQGRARQTPHVIKDQAGKVLCCSLLVRKLKICQATHHGRLQALCSSSALGLGHLGYEALCADRHADGSRHPAGS